MPGGAGLLFVEALRRACALVRSNPEVVAHPHREPIGDEVCRADDQHGPAAERAAGDAGHDGERRDDAVVGAVHQVAHVVARDVARSDGFPVR